jgi:hypothetical protein
MPKWRKVVLYLLAFVLYTTFLWVGIRYLFGALVPNADDWIRLTTVLITSLPSMYCLAKIVDIMDKEDNQDRS